MPTSDLLHKKKDKKQDIEEFEPIENAANAGQGIIANFSDWFRSKVGSVPSTGVIEGTNVSIGKSGFKTIMKKSLHFESTRYRECLMVIAMLCQENSMKDFVDNLDDI